MIISTGQVKLGAFKFQERDTLLQLSILMFMKMRTTNLYSLKLQK